MPYKLFAPRCVEGEACIILHQCSVSQGARILGARALQISMNAWASLQIAL